MSGVRRVAIVQARMSSTRLPGKVLMDLHGKPMLAWVVERARQADMLDEVVVATSEESGDAEIEALCSALGYPCFRGSLDDVLDRYYRCGSAYQADIIVRLTADCPLIDPGLIDLTVRAYHEADPPVLFATNRLPLDRSYPIGLDVEVCSMEALEMAWREATLKHQREHVMPYFYEVEDRFPILHLRAPEDLSDLRWTVDTMEDLILVRAIIDRFAGRDDFSWLEVLDLVAAEPALRSMNPHVRQKGHDD